MNSSRGARLFPLLSAIAVAMILAGCGGGSDEGAGGAGEPAAGSAETGADTAKVYFTAGEQFDPVETEIEDPASAPREATEALLDGPNDADPADGASADIDTAIPAGVEIENLEIEDGEAQVELSDEFLGEIPANAAKRTPRQDEAVNARIGQVTYTLTQFEQVDSTRIRSGGITVEPASDRADFSPPAKRPKVPPVRGGSGAPRSGGTLSLQRKLAALGYLPQSGVDGIAGYQTEQAVMAFQAWEGLDRDGVAGPATRGALATAKRPRPRAKNPRRFLEVHLSKGVLLLVEDGRAKRAIHVSGGAPGYDTPTGRYRVFRKELQSWSYPYSVWLPYASYFNNGIAFHEYADIPPYPASHGCVRVPTPEAKRVYAFAKMNRVVVVLP